MCAEQIVEWITDCIRYMREKGYSRMAATPEAEASVDRARDELVSHTFLSGAESWFIGEYSRQEARAFLLYANTAPNYRKKCWKLRPTATRDLFLQ